MKRLSSFALHHTSLAKSIVINHVKKGDIVIDATCGNGHDSLLLAQLAVDVNVGRLVSIDIQPLAIERTRSRIQELPHFEKISSQIDIICCSHETFPSFIPYGGVSTIMYNLGYLPRDGRMNFELGGGIVTSSKSTIKSLQNAFPLLCDRGIICMTAYRGHDGGTQEYLDLKAFFASLDATKWRVYAHEPLNRPDSPVLFVVGKL